MAPGLHRGWHGRGYLPHLDHGEAVQHVVFRLADALPLGWERGLERANAQERASAVEAALDAGYGSRVLVAPPAASGVEQALLHFDGQRYDLIAWCVMPTHVHVLAGQRRGWPLAGVVQGWKSCSARAINRQLGRVGKVWSADYFDRFMRDEDQFAATRAYIESNPVKAGICANPTEWPWGSARHRTANLLVGG